MTTDQPSDDETFEFDVTNPHVRDYLQKRRGIVFAESTMKKRACLLQKFTDFLKEQGTTVVDADRQDIVEYLEYCVEKGNRRETVRNKKSAVKELYLYMQVHSAHSEKVELRPIEIEDIRLARYNYKPETESIDRGPLSKEETVKLYEEMEHFRDRLMTAVGAETGLRNSDIRELKVEDVNLEDREIRARDSKNGEAYTVPITENLAAELRYWIEVRREAWLMAEESDYLFVTKRYEKISTNEGLNKIVKQAAEKAGIQEVIGESYLTEAQKEAMNTDRDTKEWHKVTVHALRHTFINAMKKSGVPLEARQHAANHKHSETTEEWYEEDEIDYHELIRELFDFR